MDRIKLAKLGEDKAADFLKNQGYRILKRNYRCKFGEIDIIAKDKNTFCFVEVKTRSDSNFGLPEDALIKKKQRHISRVALDYLKKNNLMEHPARFDVVCVMNNKIAEVNTELIKDAFCLDEKYCY